MLEVVWCPFTKWLFLKILFHFVLDGLSLTNYKLQAARTILCVSKMKMQNYCPNCSISLKYLCQPVLTLRLVLSLTQRPHFWPVLCWYEYTVTYLKKTQHSLIVLKPALDAQRETKLWIFGHLVNYSGIEVNDSQTIVQLIDSNISLLYNCFIFMVNM